MAVDKEKALELRAEGKSYVEIAQEVGCSVGWCKVHLKGVKAAKPDLALVDDVRKAGRSQNGTTSGEIKLMTMKAYPEMIGKELEDKVLEVRRLARKRNPDVVIRPYWMLQEQYRECTDLMLDYAQELWQYKEYLADKFKQTFDLDETYTKSIMFTLTALSAGENNKLLPQGLVAYGASLSNIQDELDFRNDVVPESISVPCYLDEIPDIDHGSYIDLKSIDLWS